MDGPGIAAADELNVRCIATNYANRSWNLALSHAAESGQVRDALTP